MLLNPCQNLFQRGVSQKNFLCDFSEDCKKTQKVTFFMTTAEIRGNTENLSLMIILGSKMCI